MWVAPGPRWPATSPAMTRTSAPPSGEVRSTTVLRFDVLVAGVDPLLGRGQVHPQLDPVEQARRVAISCSGGRSMCRMPAPGRHPLRGPVGDEAATADRVLVLEGPVDHVGHGLEAAVGMPRRALGLARRVLDLAHLVHVDERVEVGQLDAGEGPPDGKPSPSKPDGASVMLLHRAHGCAPGSATAMRGSVELSGTVTAGMSNSVWLVLALSACIHTSRVRRSVPPRSGSVELATCSGVSVISAAAADAIGRRRSTTSGNGDDPGALCEHPGQRDVLGRRPDLGGHLGEGGDPPRCDRPDRCHRAGSTG